MTWLYAKIKKYPELIWGPSKNNIIMDQGFHSKEERSKYIRCGVIGRMGHRERKLTPEPFRDILMQMVCFHSGNEQEKK